MNYRVIGGGEVMNSIIQQLKERKPVRAFTDRPVTAEEAWLFLKHQNNRGRL